MKRQIILEIWDSYSRVVLPKNFSTVQRWECRRAFYAGCEGVLRAILAALQASEEATGADLALMADVEDELTKFAMDVKAGRA